MMAYDIAKEGVKSAMGIIQGQVRSIDTNRPVYVGYAGEYIPKGNRSGYGVSDGIGYATIEEALDFARGLWGITGEPDYYVEACEIEEGFGFLPHGIVAIGGTRLGYIRKNWLCVDAPEQSA